MDERLDILTPDGTPAGRTRTKAEVHRDGDWHRSVHVWIVASDATLLLQLRAARKENHPSLWDVSAAGHVAAGESVVDAAVRELREELGLRVDAAELRHVTTLTEECVLNEGTYIDRELHEIFLLRRDVDPESLVLQAEEVDAVKLVTLVEFARMTSRRDPLLVPHWEEYELIAREVCRT
ncbi:MAG TPA: NUDIX domain-containing protein [Thermoanaerobaculia bacterium]|nr:NUDIX domain-containing protein [Thermoanaerobaculia bacterium]